MRKQTSDMRQRLNFTGRRRITTDRTDFEISEDADNIPALHTRKLDLNGLELPDSARIFVRVSRSLALASERIDAGTIGNPVLPTAHPMPGFNGSEGLRVGVEVVATTGERQGKLLAVAKGVRPRLAGEDGRPRTRIPLLPFVASDALGEQVWKLELGDGNPPTVAMNANIPNWRTLGKREEFQVLVIPEVSRQIAHWFLMNYEPVEGGDENMENWRRFFESLDPKLLTERPNDEDERLGYAEDHASQLAADIARQLGTLRKTLVLLGEED